MDPGLQALRRVDFEWTEHIERIWSVDAPDASGLQPAARAELVEHLEATASASSARSPLGLCLLGTAGAGKTHLLGVVRRTALELKMFFVLADMTDVRDFWATVLLGYLRSLQQPAADGRRQLDVWLAGVIDRFGTGAKRAKGIPQQRPPGLINTCSALLRAVTSQHPHEGREFADVLRALLLFACDNADINNLGYKWLQGIGIDSDERHMYGFREDGRDASSVVRGLSWLLSLHAPTVLALDQLDAIVAEHNLASGVAGEEATEQHDASLAIIQGIAGGLQALRDVTRRTLSLVSSLEVTWRALENRSVVSMADRFAPPVFLGEADDPGVLKELVLERLARGYEAAQFKAPYPGYPFRDQFFENHMRSTPRELLKACDAHRRTCREAGRVSEAPGLPETSELRKPDGAWQKQIRDTLDQRGAECDIQRLLADDSEEGLDRLVETACQAIVREHVLPDGVIPQLDNEFHGTGHYDPLHARIRLILTSKGEREIHHAFRFLQKPHPLAFQARLKAAMTASGIDHSLGFRRLTILRMGETPGGPASQRVLKELHDRGGELIAPGESELRLLWALSQLLGRGNEPDRIDQWLRQEQPVSKLPSFRGAAKWLFEGMQRAIEGHPRSDRRTTTSRDDGPDATREKGQKALPKRNDLVVGHALVSGKPDAPVSVTLHSLTCHTSVLAGAGSGKTVFLRRIIEEAALLGVSSVVIDGANDLSRLGDPWPTRPEAFSDEDVEKAQRYHESVEVVVWTPGRTAGMPLVLNPLPDFSVAPTGSTAEEARDQFDAAVEMARASLEPMLAMGRGPRDQIARAILASGIRAFAERGGGRLANLVALLREPPEPVIDGYEDGAKVARRLSELLLGASKTDRLMSATGQPLDPAVLLRPEGRGKVARVSVINLTGLQGLEAQQKFLNQVAMALFTWIRKNPASGGSLLGLLVIDEAKDFVPTGRAVACKENIGRLAAQARKYGLGMLFATQAPKTIDHTILANCSTLLVGRMNSPAAIDTVRRLLEDKGGTGEDVAKFRHGTFYLSALASPKPIKIVTPLCLSHHPANPLDEAGVLERARRRRAG